jgi:hypothetical protein
MTAILAKMKKNENSRKMRRVTIIPKEEETA